MKATKLGVQLMPLILALSSVAYYAMGATGFCVACMVLAIVMWLVLFGDIEKF